MLFNSIIFIIFAAVFYSIWPFVRRNHTFRWLSLVVASFIFYGWWDWRFLFLIIFSGMIDFSAGLAMVKWQSRKKLWLILSLITNIGLLAVFKYANFAIDNANCLMGALGFKPLASANIILPVGISFYTFQSMSYTIDVYKGQLSPTRNILHFFAYLALFPQLVAGPIVRAKDLLPQLESDRQLNEGEQWAGTRLIITGFFKKVVIADTLAPAVNEAFAMPNAPESAALWWLVTVMFAFQIYCDFSGYSDIARGLGFWMGYEFPVNFRVPYMSANFQEFWQRWHISLSSWFRDYVYIPLGGSRKGELRNHFNLWVTMLVSGLWHGAAWTFVIWGGLHAFYLSLEKITGWPKKLSGSSAGKTVSVLIVFVLTMLAWVFFRAESLAQALDITAIMLNPFKLNMVAIDLLTLFKVSTRNILIIGIVTHIVGYFNEQKNELTSEHESGGLRYALEVVCYSVLIVFCVYSRGTGDAFIYFQF